MVKCEIKEHDCIIAWLREIWI